MYTGLSAPTPCNGSVEPSDLGLREKLQAEVEERGCHGGRGGGRGRREGRSITHQIQHPQILHGKVVPLARSAPIEPLERQKSRGHPCNPFSQRH
eukprot:3939035-Rhodomonas_salina.5